jgi:hypothetical protein
MVSVARSSAVHCPATSMPVPCLARSSHLYACLVVSLGTASVTFASTVLLTMPRLAPFVVQRPLHGAQFLPSLLQKPSKPPQLSWDPNLGSIPTTSWFAHVVPVAPWLCCVAELTPVSISLSAFGVPMTCCSTSISKSSSDCSAWLAAAAKSRTHEQPLQHHAPGGCVSPRSRARRSRRRSSSPRRGPRLCRVEDLSPTSIHCLR